MYQWLIAAALCGSGSSSAEVTLPARVAATELSPTLTTGSLIGTKGDCLAVRIYTASSMTHVGAVVVQEDGPWVYESTNGVGVRKLPLADYLAAQAPNRVLVYQPRRLLTAGQARDFEAYLESQLGRPYSVKHHITGQHCEGMHCAEYATEALLKTELITAENPVRVSPASLIEGIVENDIYVAGPEQEIVVEEPPPIPDDLNCCERMWEGTKRCTSACCHKMSGWFLCR